jgi:hypothetical protein
MAFGKVYPMYVAKAAKKGRSKQEVDQIICWLTGYTQKRLDELVAQGVDFEEFFSQAKLHPKRMQITGKVWRRGVCCARSSDARDTLLGQTHR